MVQNAKYVGNQDLVFMDVVYPSRCLGECRVSDVRRVY